MRQPNLVLDDIDHELLDLLQNDSGRTLRELGHLVALSPSAGQRASSLFGPVTLRW